MNDPEGLLRTALVAFWAFVLGVSKEDELNVVLDLGVIDSEEMSEQLTDCGIASLDIPDGVCPTVEKLCGREGTVGCAGELEDEEENDEDDEEEGNGEGERREKEERELTAMPKLRRRTQRLEIFLSICTRSSEVIRVGSCSMSSCITAMPGTLQEYSTSTRTIS